MPKNTSKTGKSSKTARVLSLLTDPAASLLGGSRGHRDEDDETEPLNSGSPQARGLDDAATESRIQASLAAEEDSLVTELFGKKEPARPAPAPAAAPAPAPPSRNEPEAQEPDPRTLELLSMLSNPSTLGNSAMPLPEEGPPAALGMDFADELTAGMPEQPRYEPEPEPEPAPPVQQQAAPRQPTLQYAEPPARQQAAPQYAAPRQPTLQYAAQPAQQQPAPQYAAQPAQQQPAPQYAEPPARQQAAPQYAAQPAQQQPALQYAAQPAQQQQYAAQSVQQAAPRQKASPAANAVKEKQEEFVCFNLTQALVEDKAEKLMKQFGMCTCNRCKVDVTAIALSNLPAKYVAMQNRDILPLLSMYEEKYSAAVTVQVMNACRLVMKRPHHGR